MIDFLLATQRVESTMGLTLYRLLRYMKLALAYLLATSLAAGSGFAMGAWIKSSGAGGLLGAAAGFGLCTYFIYWSRRGRLYNLWAPHLTLFGRLAKEQTIPAGKKQLEAGMQQVQHLFDKSSDLLNLHSQSAAVVSELFIDKFKLKSIASMPVIGAWLTIKLNFLSASLRDALLTLSLNEETKNPWETMQKNLVLVANHLGSIQRSMLMVLIMQIVSAVLAFVVWYVGVDWLADKWPDVNMTGWKILVTGLLTWIMYAAFIYPIAVNAMLGEILKIKEKPQLDDATQVNLDAFPALAVVEKQAQAYHLPADSPEQVSDLATEENLQNDDVDNEE